MAVLIDRPLWFAHGRYYSHLVSDRSLAELHRFAERIGVPGRAFDADHYDVPAAYYERVLQLGGMPVSSQELVRRLTAAGLRYPKRLRAEGRHSGCR